MSIIKEDILFGRIAVLNKIITQEQFEEALLIQKKGKYLRPIGMILLEKKYITEKDLKAILETQKRLPKPAINPQEKRDDIAFAYLAVKNNLLNLEPICACL